MTFNSLSKFSATLALGAGIALGAQALVGPSFAAQPFMDAALEQLRAARASLEQAAPDKAGHRVQAINLVEKAIEEVRAGIAAAR